MASEMLIDNPFPGPRPYNIGDGVYFCGRRHELDEVRRRILGERIVILTGPSGVGKTSLLRAGVVWNLLGARRAARVDPSRSSMPPTVVLSDWGGAQVGDIESVLSSRLEAGIAALERWDPNDYHALSSAPSAKKFFDKVVSLCDVAGSLVLVFDQFEEILRGDEDISDAAVVAIETLWRYERRAHLVLCLREEYHKELRHLERCIGGVYARSYFLQPLRMKAVQEAVRQAAEAAHIQMAPAVIDEVLGWIDEWESTAHPRPVDSPELQANPDRPVDLLTLQTVLHELMDFVHRHPSAKATGEVVVDHETLAAYRNDQPIKELVGEALERWIDKALREKVSETDLTSEMLEPSDEQLTGALYRTAARLAPLLSSGGFKVAADETDLLCSAMRPDLARLRPEIARTERNMWRREGNPPRLNTEALGLSDVYDEANVSGVARQQEWSPAETAQQIVGVYYETLNRLQEGNVLKPIRMRNSVTWELVHDGLGRPFTSWAEKRIDNWDDCLYSFTACRGLNLLVNRFGESEANVRNVAWQGCWIESSPGVIFDDVTFKDSDLRGTVFTNCVFRRARFENCILHGAMFLHCSFLNGADRAPCTFTNCRANGFSMIAHSAGGVPSASIESIQFEACQFHQMLLNGVYLKGPMCFRDRHTSLFQAHFTDIAVQDEQAVIEFLDGCALDFCTWDEASGPILTFTSCSSYNCAPQLKRR